MREVARFAERDGAYVTMAGDHDKPRAHSLGTPMCLGFGFGRFNTIFRVCCEVNLREDRAIIFRIRWVLRSCTQHRHRVVVQVDLKVVAGEVCK